LKKILFLVEWESREIPFSAVLINSIPNFIPLVKRIKYDNGWLKTLAKPVNTSLLA